jgi:TolB-like protein
MANEAPPSHDSQGPPSKTDTRAEEPVAFSGTALDGRHSFTFQDGLWDKLKRHKVVEWTLAYAAAAYTLLHGTEMLSDAQEWPHIIVRFLSLLLILGVPIVVTLAWFHGHRAQHRVSRSELFILIALLGVSGTILWLYSRSNHDIVAASVEVIPTSSPATPAFTPPVHSIAVLPFTNLSGDTKQEYFSDGMSEELINALAQINALKVTARTSSFSYKGQAVDIGTIARKLNVATVLEGSIRRSGNMVRITAQLINTTTGFHMWSQNYDRDLHDVLTLESDIATQVAQQLEVKLLGNEGAKIEAGGTRNPQAYDAYLHAEQLHSSADNPAEYREALLVIDQAVALDPNYAAAHSLKARLLFESQFFERDHTKVRQIFELARREAQQAVTLAPNDAGGHFTLGVGVLASGFLDLAGAEREVRRGIELAPGSAAAQSSFSMLESWLGHSESALNAENNVIRLDPQSYGYRTGMVYALYLARRFAKVESAMRDADAILPESKSFRIYVLLSYLALGERDRVKQLCESPTTLINDDDRHYCLALVYTMLGDRAKAARAEKEFRSSYGDFPYFLAQIYTQRGDKAAAMYWLEKARTNQDFELLQLRTDWLLDPIRATPEFKAFERQMNFPP